MGRAVGTVKRSLIAFIMLILALSVVATPTPRATALAQEKESKVVRVGWYDSSYNTIDKFGRRSGYAYEYQLKIAAYTGWSYEYVTGSWSDLLQMLVEGKIDLMSDVSYTEERAKNMLFPDYSMGSEEYYLFVAPGSQEILSSDPSTLNGKRPCRLRSPSAQAGRDGTQRKHSPSHGRVV